MENKPYASLPAGKRGRVFYKEKATAETLEIGGTV
jgi:hypothetical protein